MDESADPSPTPEKLTRKDYRKKIARLHAELVQPQEWVKREQKKICAIFEGRDGADKGGVIKAFTEHVSPRTFRVIALRRWNVKSRRYTSSAICRISRRPCPALSLSLLAITLFPLKNRRQLPSLLRAAAPFLLRRERDWPFLSKPERLVVCCAAAISARRARDRVG